MVGPSTEVNDPGYRGGKKEIKSCCDGYLFC